MQPAMHTEHLKHHATHAPHPPLAERAQPTNDATVWVNVWVNNTATALCTPATLADAVAHLGIQPPFAAAVNLQFVPNTRYAQTPLQEGDHIDLVSPVTGG